MRSRRLTKKGRSVKSRSISLAVKGFAIFYLLFYTASQFTSPTTAYFNDIERIHGSLSAAGDFGGNQPPLELWDKSSLTFEGMTTGGSCKTIFAYIKNSGDGDMDGPSEFEVWWITKGNPKKGQKIYDSGKVPPLAHGEKVKLTYDPGTNPNGQEGVYKFRAFQRPGHGNKYDERKDLWSDSITIAEGMCMAQGVQGLSSDLSEKQDSLENEKADALKKDEKNIGTKKDRKNSGKGASKSKEDQVKNEGSEQDENQSKDSSNSEKRDSNDGNNPDGKSEQTETNDQSTGSKDEGSTTNKKPSTTKTESNSEEAKAVTSETEEKSVNKSKTNEKSSADKETEETEEKGTKK
ncbi:MAG TPA: amyloid fiber anchoring/assembly protein TapA [Bacillales bacterium]|nr:amyloid fiber anchoring/assembly protein TapA [Bacillales bacterium]